MVSRVFKHLQFSKKPRLRKKKKDRKTVCLRADAATHTHTLCYYRTASPYSVTAAYQRRGLE